MVSMANGGNGTSLLVKTMTRDSILAGIVAEDIN